MAATVRASKKGLEKIDQARRSKGWAKTEQAWYQLATTSEATLKRFWAGKPVQQEAFAAICDAAGIADWQAIADVSIPIDQTLATLPPSIYHDSTWVERIGLMETLLPMLQSDRRIIVLTGMTGIGKTALAERLVGAVRVRAASPLEKPPLRESPLQDVRVLRRLNLDDGGITADFATSGAALLRSLGEEPTLDDQKDERNLLNHILDQLRTHPFHIQIDSLEKLLKGDERQGWSEFCDSLWLDLWQQVLAGHDCQRQIILTTQDVPGELEAIGSRYPQRWHCEPIRGLSEAEQLELFQKRGIVAACNANAEAQQSIAAHDNVNATAQHDNVTSHNANAAAQHDNATTHNATEANAAVSLLKRIGKLYEGHPLVLRVIAEDIKTCGGDVQRYWQQCRFEELEANRPATFSRRKLQLEVNQRVRDSLNRLPDDAKQLLCRSAVYRRPVPESFWLAMLPERTPTQQQTTLNLLKAHTFAEEDWEPGAWLGADNEIPLRQHNLIRSVAYDLLKADSAWETAERQAAHLWLTAYQPATDVPNLEKVRGQIEAFHHFYEIEDWEKAKEIFSTPLNTFSKVPLPRQLEFWGCYQEGIQICQQVLGKLTPNVKAMSFKMIGNYHLHLANYPKAINFYQQSLTINRELGDRQGEGAALGNLGLAYFYLGNYGQAIKFHQQHLAIAREIGNRQGEGNALGSLGLDYFCLGNYRQAIEFDEQYLAIAREIGDRQGEGNALGNLGNAYYSLGNYPQAIAHYQQNLAIAREIGDRRGEGIVLGNLGSAYDSLGNYPQAIEFHQQRLAIAREIGDRRGEGIALVNWGHTLIKLEQYSDALERLQPSLKIFREIGDRADEAEALLRLAELHQKTGEIDQARQYCDRALALAIELGIPLVKECQELKGELEDAE